MEFIGIHENDNLVEFFVEMIEIDLYREFRSGFEGFPVANEEPAGDKLSLIVCPYDGLGVEDWKMFTEGVFGVIEDFSQAGVDPSHHALCSIDRSDIVAFVDSCFPSRSDKEVLVSVCNPDDFVGYGLADGKDEIVASFPDKVIELGWPRAFPDPLGGLGNEFSGNLSDCDHILTPAVGPDTISRDGGIHPVDLLVAHRKVGSEGRKDVSKPVVEVVRRGTGERTSLAVET